MHSRQRSTYRRFRHSAKIRVDRRARNPRYAANATKGQDRYQSLNTASTVATAVIAIAALALSLVTYADQKESEREQDAKEATRVTWYFDGTGEQLKHLTIENRSLSPAYEVAVHRMNGGKPVQSFPIELIPPCTRQIYTLSGEGKRLPDADEVQLIYRSGTDEIWVKFLDAGAFKADPENIRKLPESETLMGQLHLKEEKDLQACA